MATKPKRFIAGVVCPKCSSMDTTLMYQDDSGDDVRECIHCGFKQSLGELEHSVQEIPTRVTPVGKSMLDDGEQPLRIVQNKQ